MWTEAQRSQMKMEGSSILYQSIQQRSQTEVSLQEDTWKTSVLPLTMQNKTLFWWKSEFLPRIISLLCFFKFIFSEAGKERCFWVEKMWMEQSTKRSLMNVNVLEWPPDLNPFKHLRRDMNSLTELERILRGQSKIKKVLHILCLCCTLPLSLCFILLL